MSWINLTALWKIVVFGLLAGAGLPAIFALGLLALSKGSRTQAAGADSEAEAGPLGAACLGDFGTFYQVVVPYFCGAPTVEEAGAVPAHDAASE